MAKPALKYLAYAGGILAATALSLARQGGIGALDTIWAEDGSIFLSDALHETTWSAMSTPYAGYLHFIPRTIAEIVSLLPASAYAAALAISAAFVTGLLAALVHVASGPWLVNRWARLLVAAVTVLVPVAQDEIPNSIANLQWPGLYALFWVMIWAPSRTYKKVIAIAAVLAISLSCVLTAVYLPLALWRLRRQRDRHSLMLVGALGIGLATQAAAILFGPTGRQFEYDLVSWAPWWGIRVVPAGVAGSRWLVGDIDARWLVLAAGAWLVVAAAAVVAWRKPGNPNLSLATSAGLHSVAVYALPVILSGLATPRYAAAPAMLLIAALTALLLPSETVKWPFYAFVSLCVLVWAVNFTVITRRDVGPAWSQELAKVECSTPHKDVRVPVSPAGWSVSLPCPS